MKRRVLLVGGGTGGHITPIISLSQKLEKLDPKLEIITVGGNAPVDQKMYSGRRNHIILVSGKLHRNITLNNFVQLFLLLYGMVFSLVVLRRLKPDLIFSKAGYVSFPIIFWAKRLKVPYFIHESDMEMGASNRFAAGNAAKIFVGFPVENYHGVDPSKLEFVGQILRPGFESPDKKMYDFGLASNKPVIFVTGGSQGSRNINNAIFQAINSLLKKYSIIHHTGALDFNRAVEVRAKLGPAVQDSYFISPLLTKTADGIDLMKSAISQADVVVARASATTLAEISILKRAIIAVPYKYAAADHQSKNAIYYQKRGAAEVISDDNLTGASLEAKINSLCDQPREMKRMGENAFKLQDTKGLEKISTAIIDFVNNKKRTQ